MLKLAVLLLALPCLAKDICVLVDVSGTMGEYGDWQLPARGLITSVLAGKIDSSGWKLQGEPGTQDFAITAGDSIQVLKFGSIKSGSFPFFSRERSSSTLGEFGVLFPIDSSEYREPKTNKSLATAVGFKLALSDGVSRLIVVSDFLVDSNLNVDQQEFVNSFESATKSESPTIYTWIANPHVQVKLMRVTSKLTSLPGVEVSTPTRLTLKAPQVYKSPKRAIFSWDLGDAQDDAVTYSLTVQDPQSNTQIFSRSRFANSSLQWSDPPSGHFIWRVKATLKDSQEVYSAWTPIVIPGESSKPILLGLSLLGVVCFALWWYAKRHRPTLHIHDPKYPKEGSARKP